MSDCNHQHIILSPDFPGPVWVCRDCDHAMPLPGYDENGNRDYLLSGDPSWRRHAETLKVNWARGDTEGLYQCPLCNFLGTVDDFDVLGADGDLWFCGGCGAMVEALVASDEHWPELAGQRELFDDPQPLSRE